MPLAGSNSDLKPEEQYRLAASSGQPEGLEDGTGAGDGTQQAGAQRMADEQELQAHEGMNVEAYGRPEATEQGASDIPESSDAAAPCHRHPQASRQGLAAEAMEQEESRQQGAHGMNADNLGAQAHQAQDPQGNAADTASTVGYPQQEEAGVMAHDGNEPQQMQAVDADLPPGGQDAAEQPEQEGIDPADAGDQDSDLGYQDRLVDVLDEPSTNSEWDELDWTETEPCRRNSSVSNIPFLIAAIGTALQPCNCLRRAGHNNAETIRDS